MAQKTIDVQVAENAVKIDDHERRISFVEQNTRTVDKLNVLMEQQIEQTKDIKESMGKINENLTNLNSRFEHVEDRVGNLERSNGFATININKLWKEIIFKGVPTVLAGVILGWILFSLGLK